MDIDDDVNEGTNSLSSGDCPLLIFTIALVLKRAKIPLDKQQIQ